jgi:hypothetical protein
MPLIPVGGELFDVAEHVHVEPHAADKAEQNLIRTLVTF